MARSTSPSSSPAPPRCPSVGARTLPLTLTPEAAVEAALELAPAAIIPIHQDGWAHFTADGGDLEAAFSDAGLGGRLRRVLPGETIDLS